MNFSDVFLLITVVVTLITLVRFMRLPSRRKRGWILVSVGILVLCAGSFLLGREVAGYVGIAAVVLLLIVPMRGMAAMGRMIYRGEYARARQLGRVLRWLHPFGDWDWQDRALQAYEIASQGDLNGAKEILAQHEPEAGSLLESTELLLYRLSGDWQGLLSWLDASLGPEGLTKEPEIMGLYTRALGETRTLNDMIQLYVQHQEMAAKLPSIREECYLYLFAFSGWKEYVARTLESGYLAELGADTHTYWLATAELAAGEEERGKAHLESILEADNHLIRLAAQRRLSSGAALAEEVLSAESKQTLLRIEQEWVEHRPRAFIVTESLESQMEAAAEL